MKVFFMIATLQSLTAQCSKQGQEDALANFQKIKFSSTTCIKINGAKQPIEFRGVEKKVPMGKFSVKMTQPHFRAKVHGLRQRANIRHHEHSLLMIVYDHARWRYWIRTTTNQRLTEYELMDGCGEVNGYSVQVRIHKKRLDAWKKEVLRVINYKNELRRPDPFKRPLFHLFMQNGTREDTKIIHHRSRPKPNVDQCTRFRIKRKHLDGGKRFTISGVDMRAKKLDINKYKTKKGFVGKIDEGRMVLLNNNGKWKCVVENKGRATTRLFETRRSRRPGQKGYTEYEFRGGVNGNTLIFEFQEAPKTPRY